MPSEIATLPCIGAVKAGERVVIQIDTAGNPTVIGTVGSGDRTEAAVQDASAAASEAQSLAESVSAHTWTDAQGTHVTSFEQADSSTANGYETVVSASGSAAGSIINRVVNGVRKMLASFTQSGIGLYDGNGKSLASYTAGGFRVGAGDAMNVNATASAIQLRTGTKTGVSLTASSLDFYDVSEDGHSYNSASFSKDSSRIGRVGNAGDRKSNVYVGVVDPTAASPENIIAMRTGERNNAEFHDDRISFFDPSGNETAVFAADSARIGRIASGIKNIVLNSDAIYLRQNTVNLATLTNEAMTLGRTGSGYGNVMVNTSGLAVRSGTTELATFGANLIELGKNSQDAVIKMCGGIGEIAKTTVHEIWGDEAWLTMSCDDNIAIEGSNFRLEANPLDYIDNIIKSSTSGIHIESSDQDDTHSIDVRHDGIALDLFFIQDFVVAEGTNDFWRYRMWKSGKAECWGKTAQATIDIMTQWGTLFETADYHFNYFPGGNSEHPFREAISGVVVTQLFNSAPDICICDWLPASNGGAVLSVEKSGNQAQSALRTYATYLTSAVSGQVKGRYQYYAAGRWKA